MLEHPQRQCSGIVETNSLGACLLEYRQDLEPGITSTCVSCAEAIQGHDGLSGSSNMLRTISMLLAAGAHFVIRGIPGEKCVGRCGTTRLFNLFDPGRINTRQELKGKRSKV